ncbi:F-box protein PP2-B11-like [Neltuma alba]|uniref:F-box protein PP2-B11-like n=1 Tax=Neltuma alba TaxID=207710 RepID=UPI0010A4017F|nr:F-box protein PP2-B11-like [Prosopis alba]
MDITKVLPRDCMSKIVSFTTPRDACRSSAVCSAFKDSADSDETWEAFLPADCHHLVAQSSAPPANLDSLTKKQLYHHLCDHPLLLANNTMSFSLDKESGKKCYMIGARGLWILWSPDLRYWSYASIQESRFPEVAVLDHVWWFEVKGILNTRLLSPKTTYDVFFIFQFGSEILGFTGTFINFSLNKSGAFTSEGQVVLYPPRIGVKEREDGWLEIKVGEFYTDHEEDGDGLLEFRLWEFNDYNEKKGILVEGFEFRPKSHE